jgi:hypothetical protein
LREGLRFSFEWFLFFPIIFGTYPYPLSLIFYLCCWDGFWGNIETNGCAHGIFHNEMVFSHSQESISFPHLGNICILIQGRP